jgi:hydrogenase nickel incorporation protein HypB
MGRFHQHADGLLHTHEHGGSAHSHEHADPARDVGDHTGYETGPERVSVLTRILDENDRVAEDNRRQLDAAGVVCVNLMSSPGAGKTALLVEALKHLRDNGIRAGVIEGDIETALDAERLDGLGAQVSLVNTGHGFGGECHLDAPMVARGLAGLDLEALDLVLIENVGNLVCPAEFDVGAHRRIMVSSVTEGEDKPLKYPVMFRAVDTVVVNKIDLLPHLDFDLGLFERNVAQVNPGARIVRVSARTAAGIEDWYRCLGQ